MNLPHIEGLEQHEVRRLMASALDVEMSRLALIDSIHPEVRHRFETMVKRRLDGEPLQYIEGTVDFGPLTLLCDSRALIPRPETEHMWDLAVQELTKRTEPPGVIVDLCTGSGNLALAMKWAFVDAAVHATDLSHEALTLASDNAKLVDLGIELWEGDLFDALDDDLVGTVDVLVANPPYVSDGASLPTEIADFEPSSALLAGPDGLDVIGRIATDLGRWLAPGASFYIEIGEDHGPEVEKLFADYEVRIENDPSGRPRYLIGYH